MPSLTYVIQNYRQKEHLTATFEALLQQSLIPDEVIFTDDCSGDESVALAEQYRHRLPLKIIENKQNKGGLATAIEALVRARGDYFFILGADDQILPGFFEKSMASLQEFPQSGFVCSHPAFKYLHTGEIDLHDAWYKHSKNPCFLSPQEAVRVVSPHRLSVFGHTAIFHRKKLLEAGGFRANLRWHCDWFVLYVLALRHGFSYVPDALCALTVDQDSHFSTGRHDPRKQSEVLWNMCELLKSPEHDDIREMWLQSQLFDFYPDYAENMRNEFMPYSRWERDARDRAAIRSLANQLDSFKARLNELVDHHQQAPTTRLDRFLRKMLSIVGRL